MILQELVKLCDREELLENPDFELKPVGWCIDLAADGTLLSVRCLKEQDGKRLVGKNLPVPRRCGRTSGVMADFIVDNAQYLMGIIPVDKIKAGKKEKDLQRIKDCREIFKSTMCSLYDSTGDTMVAAVNSFLENITSDPKIVFDVWNGNGCEKAIQISTANDAAFSAPAEWETNDLFDIRVDGERLCCHEKVAAYWHDRRNQYNGEMIKCLITGDDDRPAEKHPLLKVRGAVTSGTPLISVNADAFESQGLKRNENAPIGQAAAEKYATALRRLLNKGGWRKANGDPLPEGNIVLPSDITVLFWCDKPDVMGLFPGLLTEHSGEAKNLYISPWNGKQVDIEDTSPFHTIIFSGSQGRIILRQAHTSTIKDVLDSLNKHFKYFECVGHPDSPECPGIYQILGSIKAPGDGGNAHAHLVTRLYMAAINKDLPYPDELLSAALNRIRAQNGVSDNRAKIIKAVISRKHDLKLPVKVKHFKKLEKNMDTSNTTSAYLLGRLMATLHRVQDQAIGAKADVVDRFLGSASTRPALVFPQLLELHHHHMSKLGKENKGSYIFFCKLVDEIMAPLPQEFPKILSLDEQGVFMLGFHQQRAEFWKSKEDKQPQAEE